MRKRFIETAAGGRMTSRCSGPCGRDGPRESRSGSVPARPLNVGPLCLWCESRSDGRGALSGKRYLHARWPIVALYYVLVGGHEAVGRLGVPVAAPMMILVVLAPFLALFLLIASPRRRQSDDQERRGFVVEPSPAKDEG